uniref:Uncharacterized protein n=1 Tax=Nelumbo nucifera TaxID=4432 RepID=A0A822Y1H7_NELNU|nr:TPA_asm: hypothetical protein HUJ06_026570 [Nelumbo nucifera]
MTVTVEEMKPRTLGRDPRVVKICSQKELQSWESKDLFKFARKSWGENTSDQNSSMFENQVVVSHLVARRLDLSGGTIAEGARVSASQEVAMVENMKRFLPSSKALEIVACLNTEVSSITSASLTVLEASNKNRRMEVSVLEKRKIGEAK